MKDNIIKLLLGTISDEELVTLRNWLNNPTNKAELEEHIRSEHDLNLAVLQNNIESAYEKVSKQIKQNKKPVRKLVPGWMKYAAAIAILFGLGLLFQQEYFFQKDSSILVPVEESITLQLDSGLLETIDISGTKKVRDSDGNIIGTQQQDRISYTKATNKKEELVYSTLKVPNGKRFELKLSDGTRVHLNAGSSLRYPVSFLEEGPRKVFLSGEAYFDVKKNENNPFIVSANDLNINVLGTVFNVLAYDEDTNIDVVLVEGSVSLDIKNKSQEALAVLGPGQMGSFEHNSKEIIINKVNTSIYTAWRQGHLVFRDLTFDQILLRLERHYNIEIENSNSELGKEVFNASFHDVKIEKVLSFFNDTHEITYRIKNNNVIIE